MKNFSFRVVILSTILMVMAFWSLKVKAQTVSDIVTSPSAGGAAVYSQNPPSTHTGIPGINVPLYNIQSRKLSYPISLSYQALGNKVSSQAGMTGLSWQLNAGGAITRVLRGRPDESSNGYFQFANSIPDASSNIPLSTVENLADGLTDMMPDIFYFNTGTIAGKIIFDNQLVPRCVPKSDIKVSVNSTSTMSAFTLTTPDGTIYTFTGMETMTYKVTTTYISTWYLTSIISADGTDTITFNYTTQSPSSYTTGISDPILEFFPNPPVGSTMAVNQVSYRTGGQSITVQNTQFLSGITYPLGSVVFNTGSRTDVPSSNLYTSILFNRKNPQTGLQVQDKLIQFNYSYFQNLDNSTTRLRLDGLQEYDNASNIAVPPYQFFYSAHQLPATNSVAQDQWGYYNGATSNTGLFPPLTIGGFAVSSNDLSVHGSFVDAFIISKLVEPTGSITDYFFEPNDYGSTNTPGPGLRISKITRSDPFSAIKKTTNYNYTDPTTGKSSGILVNIPAAINGVDVRETVHGTELDYTGYMIPLNPTGLGNYADSPVIYSYVTRYENDDVNTSGKVVTNFTTYTPANHNFPYVPEPDNSWQAGQVLSEVYYSIVNNVATPVKRVDNTYTESTYFTTIKGLKSTYSDIIIGTPVLTNADFASANYKTDVKFKYLSQSTVTTYEQNSSSIASLQTKNYYYDNSNLYLQPTKITTTTSNSNVILQQEITYPLDYPHSGTYGVMQDLNMISFPIETRSVRNVSGTEYITNYSKIDYATWTTHGIYPQNEYRSKIGTSGILRSAFNASPSTYCQLAQTINRYDANGFSIEIQKVKDVPAAYLIDGSICQRTASVTSANATQISYNSFETNDAGNWIFNTTLNQYQTDSKTGKYSLLLQGNNPIYRNNLPVGDYVVTYYEKNGSVTFSLLGAATLTSTNTFPVGSDGWRLQKKIVHITASADGVQLSGTCNIDELRLYPATGQVSTTNYDFAGNVITQTDMNLRSQFYEYDGSGRIILVRDHDRNIVTEYSYSTAGY